MFTKIEDITIRMDFNEGIKVWVQGPDLFYFVEVFEYEKGCSEPKYLEGHQIHSVPTDDAPFWKLFKYDARFYFDFEIRIHRCDDNEGLVLVYTHRYNDIGKYVKFEIENKNKEETELWVSRIHLYCKNHKCKPVIKTYFSDINHQQKNFFITSGIEFYRTYKIGRFPKASKDFKTKDPRKKGFLWFGFWKVFWSYEHPRNWKYLNSQEVVDDILGL